MTHYAYGLFFYSIGVLFGYLAWGRPLKKLKRFVNEWCDDTRKLIHRGS